MRVPAVVKQRKFGAGKGEFGRSFGYHSFTDGSGSNSGG
jgi:hypothetical protein